MGCVRMVDFLLVLSASEEPGPEVIHRAAPLLLSLCCGSVTRRSKMHCTCFPSEKKTRTTPAPLPFFAHTFLIQKKKMEKNAAKESFKKCALNFFFLMDLRLLLALPPFFVFVTTKCFTKCESQLRFSFSFFFHFHIAVCR